MKIIFDLSNNNGSIYKDNTEFIYKLNQYTTQYNKYFEFDHFFENTNNVKCKWNFTLNIWNNHEQFISFTETKYFNSKDPDSQIEDKLVNMSYIAFPSKGTIQTDTVYLNQVKFNKLSQNHVKEFYFKVLGSPIKNWSADHKCKIGYYY